MHKKQGEVGTDTLHVRNLKDAFLWLFPSWREKLRINLK
jgi:hypothetical protein